MVFFLMVITITNDLSEFSLLPTKQRTFDNELNNRGKRLLSICKSADLKKILNGRVSGDSLGRATFHGRNGIRNEIRNTECVTKIYF